jgi:hypothetical protein
MKTLTIIILALIIMSPLYSQSTIIFEAGTHIEVQTGASIFADLVIINGTYSGGGTVNGLPIPVELTSFSANFVDKQILIAWQTATETNNMGFEIQRFVVCNQLTVSSNEWEVLGFVEGAGTTTKKKNYNFTDVNIKSGSYKYKLKQIDLDGKFTFSNEVEVNVELPLEYALNQNYPNPFNPSTTISYSLPKVSFVRITIYDLLGAEIKSLVNEEQNPGEYKIVYDASALASGVYYYTIRAGDFSQNRKMILMR